MACQHCLHRTPSFKHQHGILDKSVDPGRWAVARPTTPCDHRTCNVLCGMYCLQHLVSSTVIFPGTLACKIDTGKSTCDHRRCYPELTLNCSFGAFGTPPGDVSIDPFKLNTADMVSVESVCSDGRHVQRLIHTGTVFRVSPNELSFASVESWKAIYGNPPPGQHHCTKSDFYDVFSAGYDSKCIGSERDPKQHARMKKHLTVAFSTKALMEQEDIIQRCVNAMIEKLDKLGQSPAGLDMRHWYEMIAFDILGEMAFGETFHCVENGELRIPTLRCGQDF